MKLWHVESDWKTGKDIAVEADALYIISSVLSNGNESQQLEQIKILLAIITDKLLDSGALSLDDIKHDILDEHCYSPFYQSEEEAKENCND